MTYQPRKIPRFPLKHKNTERNQYNFIVERVINRLAGWKSKFFFFAGRTVLVQSVMSAMPNHMMQGVALRLISVRNWTKSKEVFYGAALLMERRRCIL